MCLLYSVCLALIFYEHVCVSACVSTERSLCKCVCVCGRACVFVCASVCLCVCVYIYIYIYISVCLCVCVWVWVRVRGRARARARARARVCVCVCARAHVFACVRACAWLLARLKKTTLNGISYTASLCLSHTYRHQCVYTYINTQNQNMPGRMNL